MAEPVNFTMEEGEHIAIIGRNGSGKSMFVDILTGRHPAFPNMVEYGFDEPYKANLVLTDIQSNSDSIQYSSRGRLYRLTAIFQVQAYIAKLEERARIKVEPQFFDYEGKKLV
jgi:ABC-type molybdenum transport system ATPase subunit/photorepair protein PhrA